MAGNTESTGRTVLVTGATGVVGQALLRRLDRAGDIRVLCLTHRAPVPGRPAASIRGDITRPGLGIPAPAYRELVAGVDAVVHAAATVSFKAPDDSLSSTNVDGVRHVLEFAAEAGAPLYHVSTAYADARDDGRHGQVGVRYARSKHQGDELVRASGIPHVIIRPSIVVGDSVTGEVASFQAVYQIAEKFLRGHIPVFPFRPDARVDLIPCDVVADAIATLLERRLTDGEHWVTNGADALTVNDVVGMFVQFSELVGHPVSPPRFVPGEIAVRMRDSRPDDPGPALTGPALTGPALTDSALTDSALTDSALTDSARSRKTTEWLLNYFGAYLPPDTCLPSSRPYLTGLGVAWPSSPAESFMTSLRYWGRHNGYVERYALSHATD